MMMSSDEFFAAKFPDVNSRALRMVTVAFRQGLQLPTDSTPTSSFQAKYSFLTAATRSSTLCKYFKVVQRPRTIFLHTDYK